MADALHRLRRWYWGHFGGFHSHLESRCTDCGKVLNAQERQHYEVTCERCEGIAFHRFIAEENAAERGALRYDPAPQSLASVESWMTPEQLQTLHVNAIDGPRSEPEADGSQKPNDAAAIPCAKAGSTDAPGPMKCDAAHVVQDAITGAATSMIYCVNVDGRLTIEGEIDAVEFLARLSRHTHRPLTRRLYEGQTSMRRRPMRALPRRQGFPEYRRRSPVAKPTIAQTMPAPGRLPVIYGDCGCFELASGFGVAVKVWDDGRVASVQTICEAQSAMVRINGQPLQDRHGLVRRFKSANSAWRAAWRYINTVNESQRVTAAPSDGRES